MLEPDRDQIEIFVEALFRHASHGAVSLRSFFEDRSEPFQIVPFMFNGPSSLNNLAVIAEKMARQAANTHERVVFCPPLATFRNGRKATENDIVQGPVLSVECDSHPEAARERLETILGPATTVVRSGGIWTDAAGEQHDKLHLHWRLASPATGDDLKRLKRARTLATRLAGGDPSNVPIVHPIRWPGSWHRKGEPRLCEIEASSPDQEIMLEDALKVLEDAARAEPQTAGAQTNGGGEGRTEWEDAFRLILAGESYHPALTPLAASFASWGAPEPVTDNVLRSLLLNSQPQNAERLRRRDAELAKLPQTVHSAYEKFGKTEPPEEKQERLRWHGESFGPPVRTWLVNGLLPQTGVGLISGQWGTYKTFVALDLAAAIMAGLAFIDYPITRNGGVLFIAVEGAEEIPARLEAVLKTKHPEHKGRTPFAWIDDCPRLLGPGAVKVLTELAREAAEKLQKDFGVPLALIVIDTMADAAGYARSGDENDAALAQLVMHRCAELSHLTGALVLGVDHFGKAAETGTRGSSAKEGRADVVLALLGDKAVSGEVTNTRLAIRKNRAGPGGRELPFGVRSVEIGKNDDGEPITSLVVEWSGQATFPADRVWTKSLRLLRQILMTSLVDHGKDATPFTDGPVVRACKLETIRAEFDRQYPADGTPRQKADARRKAFQRAVMTAQSNGLIGVREVDGTMLVWLIKPEGDRS